ncbi:hypothetical protein FisN_3Hh108 [Fistulifera solaris]|uniref:Sugar phosphate phosphatase n=1 Tax=Fistulifera solaris TaxID=1519565 RepID=A0A1Z5JP04_FISSO|nr:hypothetical protein FisN_3Hh108 [Fistulifera solaris]|eukprot:GAX15636.1 hypothetical protein FisN_3Hh108 [Fistulifera solaris]
MFPSATNNKNPLPILPIPPPICSTEPGSWAYDTMSRRVDAEILQRTWDDNQDLWGQWSTEHIDVVQRFELLRNELQNAAATPLQHLEEPVIKSAEREKEYQEWQQILEPYVSNQDTWLTAPWMVTEFLIYRKLMQAIGYWDPKSPGYQHDPFLAQKQAGLHSSVTSAESVLAKLFYQTPEVLHEESLEAGLALATSIALWGNKMDLSLWPADKEQRNSDIFSKILEQASQNLLHDDTQVLRRHCQMLKERGGGQVDIIVDNAGFELVTDLALAHYLIESGIATTVTFQLKSHPTFVSDALEKDLLETVAYYEQLDPAEFPACHAAGQKWRQFLQKGQWKCHEDNFWVQPYAMWDMTEPLRSDLVRRCDLAFVKGDANYRRLLGDRTWDYTAPFQDVVGAYFPCPVCALRTLKAEIGCGMDAEQVKRAQELDDQWMVNGRFGVVHFGRGTNERDQLSNA